VTQLRLYDYAASANCYKVRLLLAQLGRDYERVAIDIFDGDTLTAEFEQLNPHRSTPVLQLKDGRVHVESNAILWYLAVGTPVLPADAFAQAEVARWLIYEQTDVMPMIGGLRFRLITGRPDPEGEAAEARRHGAHEALTIIDGHLRTARFSRQAVTRSPTSPSSPTRTSRKRRASTRRRIRLSEHGWSASQLNPGSSTIWSRTRRTHPSWRAGRPTAEGAVRFHAGL
jgi:glutathione S-transferase